MSVLSYGKQRASKHINYKNNRAQWKINGKSDVSLRNHCQIYTMQSCIVDKLKDEGDI